MDKLLKKVKLWGIGLLRTLFLGWFTDHTDIIETVGSEVAGVAGDMAEAVCSTNSKEAIDQKNSVKAKISMFRRFCDGFHMRGKKIVKEWEKDLENNINEKQKRN